MAEPNSNTCSKIPSTTIIVYFKNGQLCNYQVFLRFTDGQKFTILGMRLDNKNSSYYSHYYDRTVRGLLSLVMVKLSLCLKKHHAIETRGTVKA